MIKPKVIVYGLGVGFDKARIFFEKNVNIIGVTDAAYFTRNADVKFGFNYLNPKYLLEIEFDYIIICSDFFKEIVPVLLEQGISNKKIVSFKGNYFGDYQNALRLEKIFNAHAPSDFVALGMSYAGAFAYGMSELTANKFISLWSPGQDLFYSRLFYKKSKDKGVILTASAVTKSSHVVYVMPNYILHWCQLYSNNGQSILSHYINLPDNSIKFWDKKNIELIENTLCFYKEFIPEDLVLTDKKYYVKLANIIRQDLDRDASIKAGSWSKKYYPETVIMNKKILEDWLEEVAADGVGFTVVIPPFSSYYYNHFPEKLRQELLSYMAVLETRYNFNFIDYYQSPDFSDDDFVDSDHLNYSGRQKLAKKVVDFIGAGADILP